MKFQCLLNISLFAILNLYTFSIYADTPQLQCAQAKLVKYELKDCHYKTSLNTIVRLYSRILDPQKPTLILLPGLFRNMVPDDVAFNEITKTNLNVVFLFASVHLESIEIAKIENPKSPLPQSLRRYKIQDFAKESAETIKSLNVVDPVIVSLSATSSWTNQILDLLGTHKSIDAAPFVSFLKDSSQIKISHMLAMGLYQNPFTMMYAESMHFNSLKNYYLNTLNLSPVDLPTGVTNFDFAESLASISLANRDFDWEEENFNQTKKSLNKNFILAEKEAPERLTAQISGLQSYLKTNKGKLILVKDASHTIMAGYPDLYAKALVHASTTSSENFELIILERKKDQPASETKLVNQEAFEWLSEFNR